MKYFAAFFFLLITGIVQAQFPSELWHEGKVVLLQGDTLKGAIKYDLERDIIQLNDAKTIEAYSARKVLYFNLFDETVNRYRQFYAIPYQVTIDYKTPVLFEVLYEGKLTLLAREYIMLETSNFSPSFSSSSFSRPVLRYNFYFLDATGNILFYGGNKKELLAYMKKYDNEMTEYIKRNRLHYNDKNDIIQIVKYYNQLINPK